MGLVALAVALVTFMTSLSNVLVAVLLWGSVMLQ